MPDRPSPSSLARQRLIHDFPSWRTPVPQPRRDGKPRGQLPAEATPTAIFPVGDPLRPLLWLARREGLLLLVNESGG